MSEALGAAVAAAPAVAAAAAAAQPLDGMSDEEAEALLAAELADLNRARSEYSRG